MPWQSWLETDIQISAQRWIVLGSKSREQQGKLVKECVSYSSSLRNAWGNIYKEHSNEHTSYKNTPHPQAPLLLVVDLPGQTQCHQLQNSQKARAGENTNFLKVGQKIPSGDNRSGAHSKWQFPALPKPPNKPWILLCPSDEDIKQELRLHWATALLTLLSRARSIKKEEQTR